MPKPRFAVGDIVQQKSGGPKMTILQTPDPHRYSNSEEYRTSWFAGSKNERARFPEAALVAVEEEEKA